MNLLLARVIILQKIHCSTNHSSCCNASKIFYACSKPLSCMIKSMKETKNTILLDSNSNAAITLNRNCSEYAQNAKNKMPIQKNSNAALRYQKHFAHSRLRLRLHSFSPYQTYAHPYCASNSSQFSGHASVFSDLLFSFMTLQNFDIADLIGYVGDGV